MKNLVTHHSSAPIINPRLELPFATASKDLETCLEESISTIIDDLCLPTSAHPSPVLASRVASSGASFAASATAGYRMT